ncbi:MAG TPA: cellulase family glycosylhydrolase [Verrucomicrobiae bacterium]|nr:cellulase family glycosylhydrolase [Verrucomicrobiae bacterium]
MFQPTNARQSVYFLGILFSAIFPAIAFGQIQNAALLTANPRQYERMDFSVQLVAQWTNSPYRAEEIRLDLDLVSPSGISVIVPAYFETGKSGTLSVWKTRFTPVETGKYTGNFKLINSDKTDVSSNFSFVVATSNGKGFLHAVGDWTFRFDDGEPFRGIGENIAWESRSRDDSKFFRDLNENPRYNYPYLLEKLATNGGNFFRTWMCPWNLPLEWKTVANTNRYANDDDYFNASAMRKMDQLMDLADSLDVYMMLTLDNSGDFQGREWQRNNYNVKNGGSVATAQEFFTDPKAKAQYKDRLRYLVARWGYDPHIAAWEFFNEIDNLMYGLPQKIPDEVITAWTKEMSDYLKSIDPYHHLVTTSISHREVAGLYNISTIDFNQIHIYGHDGHSRLGIFPETLRHYSQLEQKPFVIGEFGFEWDWNKNFDDFAGQMNGDFKKGLWLGLFSPTPILPMSWWWEYFDHRNMTPYFSRVRFISDQMLTDGKGDFANVDCQWLGAPVQMLTVRCGKTFFVLLVNDESVSATGDLSLPLEVSQDYEVQTFDAERNVTNHLATLVSGKKVVGGVSIPPSDELILIFSPRKK